MFNYRQMYVKYVVIVIWYFLSSFIKFYIYLDFKQCQYKRYFVMKSNHCCVTRFKVTKQRLSLLCPWVKLCFETFWGQPHFTFIFRFHLKKTPDDSIVIIIMFPKNQLFYLPASFITNCSLVFLRWKGHMRAF